MKSNSSISCELIISVVSVNCLESKCHPLTFLYKRNKPKQENLNSRIT